MEVPNQRTFKVILLYDLKANKCGDKHVSMQEPNNLKE